MNHSPFGEFLDELTQSVLDGGTADRDQARRLLDARGEDREALFGAAARIRDARARREVDLCSIVNAKSGHCPENCSFCSQSKLFPTEIERYPLMSTDQLVKAAAEARNNGATKFGIVIAEKGPTDKELEQICVAMQRIAAEVDIAVDASLGILTHDQARRLAEAGCRHYNHNLETSRRHFARVCTTHSYDERIQTLRYCKEFGMELCSGGIFGMGEDLDDRVDLAFTLKAEGVQSVPINFLNPIVGTPLADLQPLEAMEALSIVAMLRFVIPDGELRICGGREKVLGAQQHRMFDAGANATMVGNYLTTIGNSPEQDHAMIRDAGHAPTREIARTTV